MTNKLSFPYFSLYLNYINTIKNNINKGKLSCLQNSILMLKYLFLNNLFR